MTQIPTTDTRMALNSLCSPLSIQVLRLQGAITKPGNPWTFSKIIKEYCEQLHAHILATAKVGESLGEMWSAITYIRGNSGAGELNQCGNVLARKAAGPQNVSNCKCSIVNL